MRGGSEKISFRKSQLLYPKTAQETPKTNGSKLGKEGTWERAFHMKGLTCAKAQKWELDLLGKKVE